jgi:hypothetical protein
MLYTTELAYKLPRDSFESLLYEVNKLHGRVWIYTGSDGELFHYDCAKAFNWFLLHHESKEGLKHSYNLMIQRNYVYIPMGIYVYLATVSERPELGSEAIAERLVKYFSDHLDIASGFQKEHTAHTFSHLFKFLQSEDMPVLDALMSRILTFSPISKGALEAKREKVVWQRNLNVFCPKYAHADAASSGMYTDISRRLGGDDGLIAWVGKSLPSRLRRDFIQACGREDILLQTLTAKDKRNKLNDEFGL